MKTMRTLSVLFATITLLMIASGIRTSNNAYFALALYFALATTSCVIAYREIKYHNNQERNEH